MKENVLRNVDEVTDFACSFWSQVTLDEVQLVWHKWPRGLEWGREHAGELVPE
jgi:hypothetical protein